MRPFLKLAIILSFFSFLLFAYSFTEAYGVPIGSNDMFFTHYPDILSQFEGSEIKYSRPAFSFLVGKSYRLLGAGFWNYISLAHYTNLFVVFLATVLIPILLWLYSRLEFAVYFYLFGSGILFNLFFSSIWAQLLFLVPFLLFFLTKSNTLRLLLVGASYFIHAQGVIFLAALFLVGLISSDRRFRLFFPLAFIVKPVAALTYNPALSDACAKMPKLTNLPCATSYFLFMFPPFLLVFAFLQALKKGYSLEWWAAVVFAGVATFFDLRTYIQLLILAFCALGDFVESSPFLKRLAVAWCVVFYVFSWVFFSLKMSLVFV